MASARIAVIVGAGLMGQWHARTVRSLGHRVVYVVDPDAARGSALARRVGATWVADLSANVLAGADAAHVCTPASAHADALRLVVEHCQLAICEKPLAPSALDAYALHTLASQRGALLVPVHQFLFQRGFLALQQALTTLGPVVSIDAVAYTAGADHRDAAAREMVAMDVLPHPVSMVERLCPGLAAAASLHVALGREGEVRVVLSGDSVSVGMAISCRARPPINMLRVTTESATIHLDLFHGFCWSENPRSGRAGKLLRPFASAWNQQAAAAGNLLTRIATRESAYPGLRELLRRSYAAIDGSVPPPITPAESLAVSAGVSRISNARRMATHGALVNETSPNS